MSLFIASFIVVALAVAGMAIGVINGRRGIQGSCGGPDARDGNCAGCGRAVRRCPVRRQTG
jgi:hypothetical protein